MLQSHLLKILTVPQYWIKLTGIFENENFPNEQIIAQQKLQKAYTAVKRRPTKVILLSYLIKHLFIEIAQSKAL